MSPDVIRVKARQGTKLEVEFADGSIRLFDVEPLLHYPAFSELRDSTLFMKAHVENGTVYWNEEIDISPDTLYLRGEVLNRDEAAKASSAI
jgi:hypothetical protein